MATNADRRAIPLWRDERVLKWAAQIISAIAVIAFIAFFIGNVLAAARVRGLDLGFDFLDETAGFALGESVIPFEPSMTFGRAFLVGLLNTLKVALVGIVLATFLGLFAALARLSTNWLVSKLATIYIETIRNVPLLVQLFFWYFAVFQQLPPVRRAIQLPGPTFLSQRGLYIPWPQFEPGGWVWVLALLAGIVLGVLIYRLLLRRQVETGRRPFAGPIALAVAVLIPLAGWFVVGGAPFTLSVPALERFNFRGGIHLSTEFAALLMGLIIYTGAFIAEVMRAGILAVPARAGRGRPGSRAHRGPGLASGCPSPGAAGHHPAADQPVPEPHQKLQPGHRHRLPRSVLCWPHHHQPGRPRGARVRARHGRLPAAQPDYVRDHEYLQPPRAVRGAMR
jgi:general L-amino acid transport system permease protein